MKRFAIAAAALTLVGPLAATAAYADPPGQYNNRGYGDNNRSDNYNYRNDGRGSDNQRYDSQGYDNRRGQGNDRWNGQTQHGWQNHHSWRRGDRMSFDEQSRYRSVDYRYQHLREPPRGYHYIQDDRGETLLLGIASGVILGVILNQGDHYNQGDQYNQGGRYNQGYRY